jgi:hypothetical protein
MTLFPGLEVRRAAAFALLLILGHASAAHGQVGPPRDVRLVVGRGRAFVAERRTIVFRQREQEVAIDDMPAGVDDASFVLRGVRSGIRLLEWSRPAAGPSDASRSPSVSTSDAVIVWRRPADAAFARRPGASAMRCRLDAETTGEKEVEITYLLDGLSWSADYSLLVRGGATSENEVVSIDLSGQVLLSNATSRAFRHARVTLVDEALQGKAAQPSAPGFLVLEEENPLGDLWRPPTGRGEAGQVFELGEVREIPAGEHVRVQIALAARRRAERLYTLRRDALPGRAEGGGYPLALQFVLPNTRETGLGRALPPGWVTVWVGSLRSQMRQRAWFNAVPAGGVVRIDFGVSEKVWATRDASPRLRVGERVYEQTLETAVENPLGAEVEVEVEQEPPPAVSWSVLRSNHRPVLEGRLIRFRAPVPGGGRERFSCTVSYQEPPAY